MPCFTPLRGFRDPSGGFVFARHKSIGLVMSVPCGRCIGCRLERSRQWAVRCMHEASLHEDNCFVTLTYANEHLPVNGSLEVSHFQKFMKRLRRRYDSTRIRFFHCGEYGEGLGRPHYHALLFGFDFPDKAPWTDRNDSPVWRSSSLESLWPMGISEIGSVSFESAAYVARYITKKITGEAAKAHYRGKAPEYATMSRRPGIGRGWITKFQEDVYPSDEVIVRGRATKPPRYYDSYFESVNPDAAEAVRLQRRRDRSREDETPDRLRVREVCAEARVSLLPRRLES